MRILTNPLLSEVLSAEMLNEWQPEDLWAFVHLMRSAHRLSPTAGPNQLSIIGRLLLSRSESERRHFYQYDDALSLEARLSKARWLDVKGRIWTAIRRVQIDEKNGLLFLPHGTLPTKDELEKLHGESQKNGATPSGGASC